MGLSTAESYQLLLMQKDWKMKVKSTEHFQTDPSNFLLGFFCLLENDQKKESKQLHE